MNVNHLASYLEDASYVFLTINFLWGVYCVILLWRRIGQLRFRNEAAEAAFVDQLQESLRKKDWDAAVSQCDFDYRAVPRLSLLMLTNRDMEYGELRQLVTSRLQREIVGDLEQRLSWVVTVIKNGPLLGLFGTVLGMMGAFGRIGTGEKVQPSQIADEIAVALICTAMGLATAIPLGYILSNLNNKFRNLRESMDGSLSRILEQFRPRAKSAVRANS